MGWGNWANVCIYYMKKLSRDPLGQFARFWVMYVCRGGIENACISSTYTVNPLCSPSLAYIKNGVIWTNNQSQYQFLKKPNTRCLNAIENDSKSLLFFFSFKKHFYKVIAMCSEAALTHLFPSCCEVKIKKH